MFVRCPRCVLAFTTQTSEAVCPRCSARFSSALAHAPTAAPAPPATPIAATQLAPPPAPAVAPTQAVAWSPPRVMTPPTSSTEDRNALAGRAAVATTLSALSIVGGCNPIGWIALFLAVGAYASTGQADLGPSVQKVPAALRLAWIAFASTTAVWVVSIAIWWFG